MHSVPTRRLRWFVTGLAAVAVALGAACGGGSPPPAKTDSSTLVAGATVTLPSGRDGLLIARPDGLGSTGGRPIARWRRGAGCPHATAGGDASGGTRVVGGRICPVPIHARSEHHRVVEARATGSVQR